LEKQVNELQDLLEVLAEENRLLRDYAYNVDPTALTLHQHRFLNDHSVLASLPHNKENQQQAHTRNQVFLARALDTSALTLKLSEFISKYTNSSTTISSSISTSKRVILYGEDKALLKTIRAEAAYLEQ
jgi:hypothetical protein